MNSPTILRNMFVIGLPLAVVATIIIALNYVSEQQTLRGLANEPQEYLAGNAMSQVARGLRPQPGFTNPLPIESDNAPYLAFYSASGTPVAGSAILNDAPPQLPIGVFEEAKRTGVNRITWEPMPGVRQAIVVYPTADGYVMSGRSLAYIEEQERALTKRTLIGWAGTMAAIIIVSFVSAWFNRKREPVE